MNLKLNKEEQFVKTAEKTNDSSQKKEIVRLRAVVLGIILIWFSAKWIFWGEMTQYTFSTWAAPFANAIFFLFVASIINLFFKRYIKFLAFNRLEMIALYAMVSVGSAIISSDMQGILITLMGYPTYYADEFNSWDSLFYGVLPEWLIVTDKAALEGFYKGNSDFFTPNHISAWIKPSIAWMFFIWALVTMMLCINAILRKA